MTYVLIIHGKCHKRRSDTVTTQEFGVSMKLYRECLSLQIFLMCVTLLHN